MKVGYVRTSRADQNPTNQISLLMEHGIKSQHIFVDAGISGRTKAEERDGFKAMMKFIEAHKVDQILLFEISRLGRTFLDTLNLVVQLEKKGIQIRSLSPVESWTTIEDKAIRALMLSIFTWVADRERENLVERTKLGQAQARREGKKIGRPRVEVPWGKYDELREKGLGDAAISRILNIPPTTLWRRVKGRSQ